MFGFGKKNSAAGAAEPQARASHETAPDVPAREQTLAPAPESAAPADAPKRPWFGKLFRPGAKKDQAPVADEPGVPRSAPMAPRSTVVQSPEPIEHGAPPAAQVARPAPPAAAAPTTPTSGAGPSRTPLPGSPPPAQAQRTSQPEAAPPADPAPEWADADAKRGVLTRLRTRLSRTRTQLGEGLGNIFLGRKRIDDDLMEELETLLITADVGLDATSRIIEDLAERVKRKSLADPQALLAALKAELRDILRQADGPVRQPKPGRPQVVLMVGINGAGKTTTIGKLAKRLQEEGNSVMLAAGDTFRAAAIEQLEVWGERNAIPVISQHSGADSASVVFDALQAATARGVDVLIADTAGRLHTKTNLMDELAKVARVLKKIDPEAPHEVMLVVDATTGQNALHQAEHFHRAVGLTGITLTKLDGTAKGGILFAIADRLKVPIRFVGIGETIEDLRPFDPDEFVDALLG